MNSEHFETELAGLSIRVDDLAGELERAKKVATISSLRPGDTLARLNSIERRLDSMMKLLESCVSSVLVLTDEVDALHCEGYDTIEGEVQ